jgi:hypothetical protein
VSDGVGHVQETLARWRTQSETDSCPLRKRHGELKRNTCPEVIDSDVALLLRGDETEQRIGVDLVLGTGWARETFNRSWCSHVMNARGNLAQPTQGLMPVSLVPALAGATFVANRCVAQECLSDNGGRAADLIPGIGSCIPREDVSLHNPPFCRTPRGKRMRTSCNTSDRPAQIFYIEIRRS